MTSFLSKPVGFSILAFALCGIVAAYENDKGKGLGSQPKAKQNDKEALRPAVPLPSKTPELKADKANDAIAADDITSILQARVKLAQSGYEANVEMLKQTKRQENTLVHIGKPDDVIQWSLNLLDAQRERNRDKSGQLAALEGHLKRMKQLEEQLNELSMDVLPKAEVWKAQWQILNARLWMTQAKAKSP